MNQDWSPNPPKNTPGPFDYVHQLFSHLDISDNPGSSPQIGHRTVPSPSQDGLRRWQFDDTARDRAEIGWSYDVSYDPTSMNFSRIRMAPSRRLVLPGTFPPILRTHREGPLANRRPSLLPPTVLDWLDEEIEAVQATVEDIALEDEPPPPRPSDPPSRTSLSILKPLRPFDPISSIPLSNVMSPPPFKPGSKTSLLVPKPNRVPASSAAK